MASLLGMARYERIDQSLRNNRAAVIHRISEGNPQQPIMIGAGIQLLAVCVNAQFGDSHRPPGPAEGRVNRITGQLRLD
jgi:hypothetical protein